MAVIPAIYPMGPNTVCGSHNTGYDPIEDAAAQVLEKAKEVSSVA